MLEISALGFDVFGTVVDWRSSIARSARPFLIECGLSSVDPYMFADRWRALYQPAMEACRTGARDYVPLDTLHAEMLDDLLSSFGLPRDGHETVDRKAFARLWEQLSPWPDVPGGLLRLKAKYILAPISNGSIALMTRLSRHAGLPWDAILGADLSRTYKPTPRTYLAAAEALQLDPSQVALVAAHNDDLHAARAVGMRTIFVPRPTEYGSEQTTDLRSESDWDLVATDFNNLASALHC
ncbi:haloacid dehalogenase type II [Novosphingobium sp.]|uniref:haloacid dehalogenase type II n=1 Tax=Novosphingobium sp. TaxID=1874826 RepID=UPI002FDA3F21